MPYARPGAGIYLTAAGPLTHGQPLLQAGLVGIVVKQSQVGFGGSFAAQVAIGSGESVFLITKGIVDVSDPGGATDGEKVYIDGTNALSFAPGINEQQTVTIDASGGTYTLTFSGQTTGVINFNDNAATVQAALIALSNIAPGDVVVTGGPGATAPLAVTFSGAYLDVNVPQMTSDATLLTGGASTATVATVTGGVAFTKFGEVVEVHADKRGVKVGRMRVDLDKRDSF